MTPNHYQESACPATKDKLKSLERFAAALSNVNQQIAIETGISSYKYDAYMSCYVIISHTFFESFKTNE